MLRGFLNKFCSLSLLALAASGAMAADLQVRVAGVCGKPLSDVAPLQPRGHNMAKSALIVDTLQPQESPSELEAKSRRYQAKPDAP